MEPCHYCPQPAHFTCAVCGRRLCYLHVLGQQVDPETSPTQGLLTRCPACVEDVLAVPRRDRPPAGQRTLATHG